jgi:hypothetical protein
MPSTTFVNGHTVVDATWLQDVNDHVFAVTPQLPIDYQDYDNTVGAPTYVEGRVFYDPVDHTLAYYNDVAGITVNVGQEQILRVRNATGSTITNGSVVYINGANGTRPTVALAKADAEVTSSTVIGVATQDITNNTDGYITVNGLVHDLDTSAFTAGDAVYLSAATAGAYTNVKPVAPNHAVQIGFVTRVNPTQGVILVVVQNGYELDELHDVLITSKANNDSLFYDSVSGTWKNKTPEEARTALDAQQYDANTAKTNVDQTWTGSQRGTVGTANTANYAMDQYNNFTTTLSTSQTIAFTGIAAGQSGNILWTVTGTPTISKNSYVKVSSTLLATLGTAGTYWLSYYSPDGTNVYISSTGILT